MSQDPFADANFQNAYRIALQGLTESDKQIIAGLPADDLIRWVHVSPAERSSALAQWRPKPPRIVPYRVTCPACDGVAFLDLPEEKLADDGEMSWASAYRRCPHCEAHITIKSADLQGEAVRARNHGDSAIPNPLYLRKPGEDAPRPIEGSMFDAPKAESSGCLVAIVLVCACVLLCI